MQKKCGRCGDNYRFFRVTEFHAELYDVFRGPLLDEGSTEWKTFDSIARARGYTRYDTEDPVDAFVALERDYAAVYQHAFRKVTGNTHRRIRPCRGYIFRPTSKGCRNRACPTCFMQRLVEAQAAAAEHSNEDTVVTVVTVANPIVVSKLEQEWALAAGTAISDLSSKTSRVSDVQIKVPHIYDIDGVLYAAMTMISVVEKKNLKLFKLLAEKRRRSDVREPIIYDNANGKFLRSFEYPLQLLINPDNEEALRQVIKHTAAAKFSINYCKDKREKKRIADEKNATRRAKDAARRERKAAAQAEAEAKAKAEISSEAQDQKKEGHKG